MIKRKIKVNEKIKNKIIDGNFKQFEIDSKIEFYVNNYQLLVVYSTSKYDTYTLSYIEPLSKINQIILNDLHEQEQKRLKKEKKKQEIEANFNSLNIGDIYSLTYIFLGDNTDVDFFIIREINTKNNIVLEKITKKSESQDTIYGYKYVDESFKGTGEFITLKVDTNNTLSKSGEREKFFKTDLNVKHHYTKFV